MNPFKAILALLPLVLATACGSTSGSVLDRIDPIQPPSSNVRFDVLLVRDVSSCAVGTACRSNDPQQCFHLTDSEGGRVLFEPQGLQFLPPTDPSVTSQGCFRIGIDELARVTIQDGFEKLAQSVFQLSGGKVNLDLRVHDLPPIEAGFKRWENRTGIFLQPAALEAAALPLLNRETDFVFAVTGINPIGTSPLPKVDLCAGTNWFEIGTLGGTAYTWVSAPCAQPNLLLAHFMIQSYFAMRDVEYFENIYENEYPACGRGDTNPRRWFPGPDDCARDPDWSGCGTSSCRSNDSGAFEAHILQAHWPEDELNGNHCQNGRLDYDETSIDAGGVCDLLGR